MKTEEQQALEMLQRDVSNIKMVLDNVCKLLEGNGRSPLGERMVSIESGLRHESERIDILVQQSQRILFGMLGAMTTALLALLSTVLNMLLR